LFLVAVIVTTELPSQNPNMPVAEVGAAMNRERNEDETKESPK
jgi:hypothetical protein